MPRDQKPESKFCRHHHCHADNCKFAAGEASEEPKVDAQEAFKDDAKATEMVEEWAKKNVHVRSFESVVLDIFLPARRPDHLASPPVRFRAQGPKP